MSLEQVIQIITESEFSSESKKRLRQILPNLDKYTLTGLGRELSRGDSLFIIESLVRKWENFARILEGLRKNDGAVILVFFKLLNEIKNNLNPDDKFYFLNLVLDVRALARTSRLDFSTHQYEQLLDYEISLFWHLPKDEVIFLLQNHLLFLESRVDLLKHIQTIAWENNWDYAKNFSTLFSDLFYKNEEILGSSAPKPIGTWVKEYFNFTSPTHSQATVVGIAEFLVKNSEIQKLTSEERKTLSEILKLFVWFLEPEINEEEVLEYKEEISSKEAERIEMALKEEVERAKLRPVAPKGPLGGGQKAVEDIDRISNVKYQISNERQEQADNKKTARLGAVSGDAQLGMLNPHLSSGTSITDHEQDEDFGKGLKFGTADSRIKSDYTNRQKPIPPKPQAGIMNQESGIMNKKKQEIDRKLEELKKKVKGKNQEL